MADWRAIERRLGVPGLEAFAAEGIAPHLKGLVAEPVGADGRAVDYLALPVSASFGFFILLLIAINATVPDSFLGVALKVIFYPLGFLAAIAASLCLFRRRIISLLIRGKERFAARSRAFAALATKLGFSYVPSPGGAPLSVTVLAKCKWSPQILRDLAAILDTNGGMDEAVAAARRSGLFVNDAPLIASATDRLAYIESQSKCRRVEDGFEGTRAGVPFSAFEWVESVDDAPDIHHLALMLRAPMRLQGVTQLRSRGVSWPAAPTTQTLKPVGLGSAEFAERFRVRSTDKVEARAVFDPVVIDRMTAFAHGADIRAVAQGERLIFDFAGTDRFALVDLKTGQWSDETIRNTLTDIAHMLELADAAARAFRLRAAA
jgi:hypothetical protein